MTENNEKDLKRTEIEDNEAEKVAGGAATGGTCVVSSSRAMATVGSGAQKLVGATLEDTSREN